MLDFLSRRFAAALVTLALATLVIFAVVEVLPGDPALVMLGTDARPDTLAALRAQHGFDRPLPVRYLQWIGGLLSFNLGNSFDRCNITVKATGSTCKIGLRQGGLVWCWRGRLVVVSHHRTPVPTPNQTRQK